jgi:hypothetical protein
MPSPSFVSLKSRCVLLQEQEKYILKGELSDQNRASMYNEEEVLPGGKLRKWWVGVTSIRGE